MATTSKKTTLTPRQREIYEFLKDKILNRGYGPTVREIGTQFGIRSPNGVMCHLKALEKKGLITREQHMSRAIQLTDKPSRKTAVSVIGRISNANPRLKAKSNDYVDFAELCDGDQFCLKVTDSSLSQHNISEGDHIIGRPQQSYRDGDLVVAVVDGSDAVLRRYYREMEGIRLETFAGRSSSKPIRSNDVEVKGVVVGVIRKLG